MPSSEELFKRAAEVIPGAVNSPVRSFAAVSGEPRFIASAEGCRIRDVDGREYIDYVASWGPGILGHAHPAIVDAVREAAGHGLTFGAPTEAEVVLAELLTAAFDSMDSVRLVNSGTEATMSAVRLARAVTGRSKIVKFEGCYHGHVDSLLVKAGSGPSALGVPTSPGIPAAVVESTITLPFNEVSLLQDVVEHRGEEIACVIVEPVPANMGLVLPHEGYLELLREVTEEYGILLVFDEVVTGFRLCYGGAQTLFGVQPDLTCLGKIIGGGLPVGAYGGRRDIMDQVAPSGPVYQAGTLSGNPIATAAGIATLRQLREDGPYGRIGDLAARLAEGLRGRAAKAGVALSVSELGSCLGLFFGVDEVTDYDGARAADAERYGRFFHAMLDQGIYLAPSPFETLFVSAAHTEAEIDATLDAAERAFAGL